MHDTRRIEAEILRLAAARGPDKSICPSEVARALDAEAQDREATGRDWQRHMGPVRRAAAGLARAGLIDILRKGRPIDPDAIKGVIRLRLRPGRDAPLTPGR